MDATISHDPFAPDAAFEMGVDGGWRDVRGDDEPFTAEDIARVVDRITVKENAAFLQSLDSDRESTIEEENRDFLGMIAPPDPEPKPKPRRRRAPTKEK